MNAFADLEATSNNSKKSSRRETLGKGSLALVDQAVVSGTNFVTTVIIGRIGGESELGRYTIGFTILVMLWSAQESLVTMPYTVFGRRAGSGLRRVLLGTVLVHQQVLSAVAAATLLLSAILTLATTNHRFGHVLLTLSATVIAVMFRDFVRRIAFAELRFGPALLVDVITCVVQLAGLFLFVRLKQLSAVAGHICVGMGCAAAVVVIILVLRPKIGFHRRRFAAITRQHWVFGRWMLLSQLIGTANGFLVHWIIAFMLGTAEAGVFAACLSLVLFTNPLVIGVSNILTPSFARRAGQHGDHSVREPVVRAALLLGGTLACVCIVILIWGDQLMGLVFGDAYERYGSLAAIVALGILLRSLGVAPENGLRAINYPTASVIGRSTTFVVTLGSALLLVPSLGLAGGAYAMVLGYAVGNGIRWILFWNRSAREPVRTEEITS